MSAGYIGAGNLWYNWYIIQTLFWYVASQSRVITSLLMRRITWYSDLQQTIIFCASPGTVCASDFTALILVPYLPSRLTSLALASFDASDVWSYDYSYDITIQSQIITWLYLEQELMKDNHIVPSSVHLLSSALSLLGWTLLLYSHNIHSESKI